MSWLTDNDPVPGDAKSCDAIEDVIIPRARDLGGFEVRRPALGQTPDDRAFHLFRPDGTCVVSLRSGY
jgi:hypothetical protein